MGKDVMGKDVETREKALEKICNEKTGLFDATLENGIANESRIKNPKKWEHFGLDSQLNFQTMAQKKTSFSSNVGSNIFPTIWTWSLKDGVLGGHNIDVHGLTFHVFLLFRRQLVLLVVDGTTKRQCRTCHSGNAHRRDLHAVHGAYCAWCPMSGTSLQLSSPCWVFAGLVERKCRHTAKKRSWIWYSAARLPKMQEDSVHPFVLARSCQCGHKRRNSASTPLACGDLLVVIIYTGNWFRFFGGSRSHTALDSLLEDTQKIVGQLKRSGWIDFQKIGGIKKLFVIRSCRMNVRVMWILLHCWSCWSQDAGWCRNGRPPRMSRILCHTCVIWTWLRKKNCVFDIWFWMSCMQVFCFFCRM